MLQQVGAGGGAETVAHELSSFSPGLQVRLVPEADNPNDSHAVAVFDRTGRYRAGYVNKQKARAYLKRLATGEQLTAIPLRGSRPGGDPGMVSTLVAVLEVRAQVRASRPAGSPPSAHWFTQG